MSIFPVASDARNGARNSLIIFNEVTYIQEQILEAIAAGSYSVSVTDSYMTSASVAPALITMGECAAYASTVPVVTIGTIVSTIEIITMFPSFGSVVGSISSSTGDFFGVVSGSIFPSNFTFWGSYNSTTGIINGSVASTIDWSTGSNCYNSLYPRRADYCNPNYFGPGYYNRENYGPHYNVNPFYYGPTIPWQNAFGPTPVYPNYPFYNGSLYPFHHNSLYPSYGSYNASMFSSNGSFIGTLGATSGSFVSSLSITYGTLGPAILPTSCSFDGYFDSLSGALTGSMFATGGMFNNLLLPESSYFLGSLDSTSGNFSASIFPSIISTTVIPSLTLGTIIPYVTIGSLIPTITIGTVIASVMVSTLTPVVTIDSIDISIVIDSAIPAPSVPGTGLPYYQVWQNLTTDPVLDDQMNQVITFFQNLGYTITRLANSGSTQVFYWSIQW
jgi:hypothetical protein